MRSEEPKNTPQSLSSDQRNAPKKGKNQASKKVTEARASAQRAKLDAQAEGRKQESAEVPKPKEPKGKNERQRLLANRRAGATLTRAIDDYLLDHEGGNHSPKTLEWHRTALGLNTVNLRPKGGEERTESSKSGIMSERKLKKELSIFAVF